MALITKFNRSNFITAPSSPPDSNIKDVFVAVIGAGGMLGTDVVVELERRGVAHRGFARAQCDVTSFETCRDALLDCRPSVVINCAAYTDVNRAEAEEIVAMAVNRTGASNVARACADVEAACIYVSTDYVFDGTKTEPYETTDRTNPVNAYGRTKLAGELVVSAVLPADKWTIARTSWLYGANGPNFVKTMLRLAREGKDLKIINDQKGAPTYTVDLAHALVDLAVEKTHGIVHVTNGGACTWFEFAQEIFRLSGVHPPSLAACATAEFPTPARRPANSRLSAKSLVDRQLTPLPPWQDALRRYLTDTGDLNV